MPRRQFDVRISADLRGEMVYRISANSAEEALSAVQNRTKEFQEAECVHDSYDVEFLHRDDVTLGDVTEFIPKEKKTT